MNKIAKNIIYIIMVSLITSTFGLSISSITTDKPYYAPGDSGILYVSILNTYMPQQGEHIERFESLSLSTFSSIVGNRNIYIGNGQPNSAETVAIPFKVSNETADGTYIVRVRVSGYAILKDGTTHRESDVVESTYAIGVVKEPVMNLKIQPETIDKKSYVNITICSKKGNSRDVVISIQKPFISINGPIVFGDIKEGECKTKTALVDASLAKDGANEMIMYVMFKDGIGNRRNTTLSTIVYVSKNNNELLIEQKQPIVANRIFKAKFIIKAISNDLYNLKLSVNDKNFKMVGVNKMDIGNLSNGETKEINVDIFTTLSPGIHTIAFNIEREEDGKKVYETINVPVEIISEDKVNVYIEGNGKPIVAKEKYPLTVVVSNGGDYEIKGTTVSIKSKGMEIIDIENEKFFGSVDPDDFTSDQFYVIFNEPGEHDITVKIKYYDASGRQFEKTKTVKIYVKENQTGEKDDYLIVIGGIALVLIAAYIWTKRRKHK